MECYRTTDWEMFQEDYGDDIEGLTQCVTDYIKFCEECCPHQEGSLLPQQQTLDQQGHQSPVEPEEESLHGRRQ